LAISRYGERSDECMSVSLASEESRDRFKLLAEPDDLFSEARLPPTPVLSHPAERQ
jgi:hypothetical protein